jgi:hypothetical protein
LSIAARDDAVHPGELSYPVAEQAPRKFGAGAMLEVGLSGGRMAWPGVATCAGGGGGGGATWTAGAVVVGAGGSVVVVVVVVDVVVVVAGGSVVVGCG